jgi:ribosome biogenesis GTPase
MAKKKVRVDLRKNRSQLPRENTWTQQFQDHGFDEHATLNSERVRTKGDLSRRRTIMQDDVTAPGSISMEQTSVDQTTSLRGRVVRVHGLQSVVQTDDGQIFRCAVRRLLKSLVTDARNVVATGDIVWFRPEKDEGMIERVEPRHGMLTRASRGREHVLVANVDQVCIVVSLARPALKPHLIDRYLASAQHGGLKPIICLNKIDLVEAIDYQHIVGGYHQLGITTLLTSAEFGDGIDELKQLLAHRATVFSGQSGVGKSSLLNAIQPGLGLHVREVSDVNQKGRHTTTTAELHRLDFGGWVVDTPGVRQLELWDISKGEVEGFFPEFHPFIPLCAFPDCTHIHETGCAVKHALVRRLISHRRYTSYIGMMEGASEC